MNTKACYCWPTKACTVVATSWHVHIPLSFFSSSSSFFQKQTRCLSSCIYLAGAFPLPSFIPSENRSQFHSRFSFSIHQKQQPNRKARIKKGWSFNFVFVGSSARYLSERVREKKPKYCGNRKYIVCALPSVFVCTAHYYAVSVCNVYVRFQAVCMYGTHTRTVHHTYW